MKWVFRLVTLTMLAVAMAFPFFMKNKDGQPMMTLPGLSGFSLPALPQRPVIRTVYKWQDNKGVWHYGDTPPAGIAHTSLEVNDQTNLIQMLSDEERARLVPAPSQALTAADPASISPAGTTPAPAPDSGLTVERALNIMNEAKAVSGQMEARNQALQRIVGEN